VENARAVRIDVSVVRRVARRARWVPSLTKWECGLGFGLVEASSVGADGFMKASGEVVGDVRRA